MKRHLSFLLLSCNAPLYPRERLLVVCVRTLSTKDDYLTMELKHVALVIVDISGYTQFLRQRSLTLLHAEEIITQIYERIGFLAYLRKMMG